MKAVIVILAAWLLTAVSANAQGFDTGEDLLRACKSAINRQSNDPLYPLNVGSCLGYVDGFVAGYSIGQSFKDAAPVCGKVNGMPRMEMAKLITAYLEARKENLSDPKALSMLGALWAELTCK